ncbi:MAG: amidohydrolase family protein [bacterium]
MRLTTLRSLLTLGVLCLGLTSMASAADPDPFVQHLNGHDPCILLHAHILPMLDQEDLGEIVDGWVMVGGDGKIEGYGPMSAMPIRKYATLDCEGMWLTPGLIDANTELGLSGHPVVEMTQDQTETTERALPLLRVTDGINPMDKAIPLVRAAGITTVYVTPGGSALIGGQGALIKLRQVRNIDEMVLKAPAGMHLNLGEGPKATWGGRGGPSTRMGTAAVLRQELTAGQNWIAGRDRYDKKVRDYEEKHAQWVADQGKADAEEGAAEPAEEPMPPDPPDRDLRKESLALMLRGEIPAIISCHRQDDILTALRLAEEFHLHAILLHATGAWQVADEIKAAGVPILLGPIRTPPDSMETLAARLDNAMLLRQAGIPFAIQTGDALGVRALSHEAAWAESGGLSASSALLSITRWPAEILGVADHVGSIETGKDADLVLWTMHPLETATVARYVIIDGQLVSDSETTPEFIQGPGW